MRKLSPTCTICALFLSLLLFGSLTCARAPPSAIQFSDNEGLRGVFDGQDVPQRRILATLGGSCSATADCSDGNQVCTLSVCKCATGYYASSATGCVLVPAGYFPAGPGVASLGSRSLAALTTDSSGTKLVAGEKSGYLFTSSNSGATWVQRTTSSFCLKPSGVSGLLICGGTGI
jgi:hypothetical protein